MSQLTQNTQKSKQFYFLLSLVISIFAIYARTLTYDFINFDDRSYVSENPFVQSGITWHSIKWALTADLFYDSRYIDYWQPVTALSHAFVAQFYGENSTGHHLLNVILHSFNSILLFLILNQSTRCFYRSAFTAMLFAFHPIQVEAVAWITARKDLLSTFFALFSIWLYTKYVFSRSKLTFTWVVIFFCMGCMAKPSIIFLPLILVLFDIWPLKTLWSKSGEFALKTLKDKKILFACSALFFFIFAFGASHTIQKCFEELRWADLLLYPAHLAFYVSRILFPVNLTIYGPFNSSYLMLFGIIGVFLLIGSSFILWITTFKSQPYLLFGFLWFLIGLIPIFSLWPADRFMYFPIIGLLISFSWGLRDLTVRFLSKSLFSSFALIGIFVYALLSFHQSYYWQNFQTLIRHAIEVDPSNYIAQNYLAVDLIRKNRMSEAELYLREALRTNPSFAAAHDNLGYILEEEGKLEILRGKSIKRSK